MTEEFSKAKFLGKREEATGIETFSFQPEKKMAFKAGQFAFFEFEWQGQRQRKHFTVSSSPSSEKIEFTTLQGYSEYKKALEELPQGAEIKISEPMGNFTLESRKGDKIAFLAGGIGITPVRSILLGLDEKKQPRLQATVLYSNRNEQRILFKEELDEIAKRNENIQVIHTLTHLSEEEKKKWSAGETGFIDRKMVKRHLQNEQDFFFYIVGPSSFNEAMKKMLLEELAIKEEMLLFETFSGY